MPETIFLGGFYRALDRGRQKREMEARMEREDRELELRSAMFDHERQLAAPSPAAMAVWRRYNPAPPSTVNQEYQVPPNFFSAVGRPGVGSFEPTTGTREVPNPALPQWEADQEAIAGAPWPVQEEALRHERDLRKLDDTAERFDAQRRRWDRVDELAAQRFGLSIEQYLDLRDHRAVVRGQGQQRIDLTADRNATLADQSQQKIDLAGRRQDDLQVYRAELNDERDRQYELDRRALGLRAGTPEDDEVKAMQDDLSVARTLYRAAAAEAAGLDGLLTTPAQRAEVTRRFEAAEANLLRAGEQLKRARIRAGAAKRAAAAPASASDEVLIPTRPAAATLEYRTAPTEAEEAMRQRIRELKAQGLNPEQIKAALTEGR